MYAVTLAGGPFHYLVQENYAAAGLRNVYVEVLDSLYLSLEDCELVVMGGE